MEGMERRSPAIAAMADLAATVSYQYVGRLSDAGGLQQRAAIGAQSSGVHLAWRPECARSIGGKASSILDHVVRRREAMAEPAGIAALYRRREQLLVGDSAEIGISKR